VESKTCTKCGQEKSLSFFSRQKRGLFGLHSQCRLCQAKRFKEWSKKNYAREQKRWRDWYKKNRRAKTQYAKKYRELNPEKVAAATKDWAKRNPDKMRAIDRRKYEKHKSKMLQNMRVWRSKNPDKVAVIKERRRARESGAAGDFTAEAWIQLKQRARYQCLCCRKKKKLTIDHVVPLSKGGTNDISNIQPLCRSCNSKKRTRLTDFRVGLLAGG